MSDYQIGDLVRFVKDSGWYGNAGTGRLVGLEGIVETEWDEGDFGVNFGGDLVQLCLPSELTLVKRRTKP